MHFEALNVKNTYLFYVLCRFLVLISVFLYLFPFLSGQSKYYLFGAAPNSGRPDFGIYV